LLRCRSAKAPQAKRYVQNIDMTDRTLLHVVLVLFSVAVLFGCYHQRDNQTNKETTKSKSIIKYCIFPNVYNPVYSSDDKYIVFGGECNRKSSIYRINSNGTGLKKLTAPFGYSDAYPQVLPNNKILFTSYKYSDSCGDLCIMNIDGTNPVWLTNNGNGGRWHTYSKKNDKIYFVSSCNSGDLSKEQMTYDIFTIKPDGTQRSKITEFEDFFIRYLSVAVNGNSLIFQRQTFKTNPSDESLWELSLGIKKECFPIRPDIHQYLSNYKSLKNRNIKHWTNAYSSMTSPKYSPDGDSLLFVWPGHYQGHFGHEIYLMDVKSKFTKKLTDLKKFIVSPSFSNDGKNIIFSVGYGYLHNRPTKFALWRINVDGSGLEQIVISQ
jgi:Tol biopolymer transport system component